MIQHSLKWKILFVLSSSFLIHLAPTKGCVYEFITHPNKKLSCNPLGYQLQLHCAVSGPSSPSFILHWYMGNRDGSGADVLLDSMTDYSTMSGEMVVRSEKGGEKRRTVSTVLRTAPILDSHHDQCFWCEAELEDMEVSLYKYKHKFCFDAKELSILSPCEDVVVVANIQLSCITLEDIRVVRSAKKSKVHTTAVSPISYPSSSVLSTFEQMINTTPSSLPFNTVNSRGASSNFPFQNTSAVNAPSLTVTTAVPTSTTLRQTTSMRGGLIATITICVVFILVIIILVGIIICLSRNRRSSCKVKKEEEEVVENRNPSVVHIQEATTVQKQSVQEDNADYDDADYDDADYDSLVITTADLEDIRGGGNVTDYTSSPQHQRQTSAPLDFPLKLWKKDTNSPRENHHFNFKSPPPPPPLPSAIYNHLSDQHLYQKCYDAEEGDSNMPPTAHQHRVSKEHIYHTLESSSQVDCSQLVPAAVSPHSSYHGNQSESYGASHGGSKVVADHSQEYSEIIELRNIEQMSPNSMAHQIRKLFDDPRYAMMMVEGMREKKEGEEGEGGLSGRREMWHSTPTLGSTCLTGRTEGERRSLRLPHAIVGGKSEPHLKL